MLLLPVGRDLRLHLTLQNFELHGCSKYLSISSRILIDGVLVHIGSRYARMVAYDFVSTSL